MKEEYDTMLNWMTENKISCVMGQDGSWMARSANQRHNTHGPSMKETLQEIAKKERIPTWEEQSK